MSKRPRSALLTQKILAEHKDLYLQVTSLNPFFSAMVRLTSLSVYCSDQHDRAMELFRLRN